MVEFYENDNDILFLIELLENGLISLNDLEFCDFIIY